MSQHKKNFIQFRIDSDTKLQFKNYCNNALNKPMSWVFNQCINECISNNASSPANDDDHLDQITNLDYAPSLKALLIELMKVRHEEYACLKDDTLMDFYKELYQSNQLFLLFENEHFNMRIRAEWS
jgi:antitoxin component of RelBE/YafQ-DinJ toxin-antitoxin module